MIENEKINKEKSFKCYEILIILLFSFIIIAFAFEYVDDLVIILVYGIEAFNSGLHFSNSKTGELSNGTMLPLGWNLFRFGLDGIILMISGYTISTLLRFIEKKIKERKRKNKK
ncbi:MAG: hypothetical protein JW881_16960 [Spirochaetales bacterium]|nr:hypothetical protein [Spirochaetales bacterium]